MECHKIWPVHSFFSEEQAPYWAHVLCHVVAKYFFGTETKHFLLSNGAMLSSDTGKIITRKELIKKNEKKYSQIGTQ